MSLPNIVQTDMSCRISINALYLSIDVSHRISIDTLDRGIMCYLVIILKEVKDMIWKCNRMRGNSKTCLY